MNARPMSLAAAMLACLLVAARSDAAGVNLRWNACAGDGGVANRSSACSSNLGTQSLVASFVLGFALPVVTGLDSHVLIDVGAPSLPPWWQFKVAGSCRLTALSANAVIAGSAVNCLDPFGGATASGVALYTVGALGPNTARFVVPSVLPGTESVALSAGQEYFAFNVVIQNVATTGAGACTGCLTPACIAIGDLSLYTQSPAGATPAAVVLAGPANGVDSGFATWQGGIGTTPLPGGSCPAATPTRNSTWGAVKSLYR